MDVGWVSDGYQMPNLPRNLSLSLALALALTLIPMASTPNLKQVVLCIIPIYGHLIIHFTHIWSYGPIMRPIHLETFIETFPVVLSSNPNPNPRPGSTLVDDTDLTPI